MKVVQGIEADGESKRDMAMVGGPRTRSEGSEDVARWDAHRGAADPSRRVATWGRQTVSRLTVTLATVAVALLAVLLATAAASAQGGLAANPNVDDGVAELERIAAAASGPAPAGADPLAAARERGAVDHDGRARIVVWAPPESAFEEVPGDHEHVYGHVHLIRVAAHDAGTAAHALAGRSEVTSLSADRLLRVSEFTPDDTYFHHQETPFTEYGILDAWGSGVPEHGATVAILDTGVNHGDDLPDERVLDGKNYVADRGDDETHDEHGHGTQSALVAAAEADNDFGIAGVCPSCDVLPVRVMGDDGTGSWSDVSAGIEWAANQGAEVISMSLAGVGSPSTVDAAVTHARGQGAVLVASAGNDGLEEPEGGEEAFIPAGHDDVIGVAGRDDDGDRHEHSNYGDWVDLAVDFCNASLDQTHTVGQWYCGTSSSAPFVAGATGLLAADVSDVEAAADAVLATADHVGYVAHGTLDAGAARYALTSDAGEVTGTVTSAPSGTSVEGAQVSLDDAAESHTAATDGDGEFAFADVAAGTWTLEASADGHAPHTVEVTVDPGEVTTVEVTLDEHARLSGVVTSEENNDPLEGATVSLEDGVGLHDTTTDADGAYELTGLATGTHDLSADADEHDPVTVEVTLEPDGEHTEDLSLPAATGAVAGEVAHAGTDHPVADAEVRLYDGHSTHETATDAAGAYELAHVEPGEHELEVTADGYEDYAATVTVEPEATTGHDVELEPLPGEVSGTVLGEPGGDPLAGAEVTLEADATRTATTNGDGTFVFADVPAGTWTVEATANDHVPAAVEVTVDPGEETTVTVALDAHASVGGTVTDAATGAPIADAHASLDDGESTYTVATDDGGEYALTELAAASYAISVTATGYDSYATSITVEAGEDHTLDVALTETEEPAPSPPPPPPPDDDDPVDEEDPDEGEDSDEGEEDEATAERGDPDPEAFEETARVRVAGSDRHETATAAAERVLTATATSTLWVATGRDFADALAAGPSAAQDGSAVVLVEPGELPAVTSELIEAYGISDVYLAGGTSAISEAVEAELVERTSLAGDRVTRVAGADRYETAAEVATTAFNTAEVVWLATGENYPDALAASAAAGSRGEPLLLTRSGELPQVTRDALADLGAAQVNIVGGSSAVSEAVVAQLGGVGYETVRLAGADRFATAVAVAAEALPTGGHALLATGRDYPDALAGGPLGALLDAPVLLTEPDELSQATRAELEIRAGSGMTELIGLGGANALAPDVLGD